MSEKFGLEKKDQPNFSKICLNLMSFHECSRMAIPPPPGIGYPYPPPGKLGEGGMDFLEGGV